MQKFIHLIDTFVPEHYTLSVTLDRLQRQFHGTVSIEGSTPQADSPIHLHAKDLTISTVIVDGKGATYEVIDDELVISQPSLTQGEHILTIQFSGSITDSMHGLYPSYYDHEGQKKELLATQFESHHAREVFPSIDEPAAKATFDLTLTTEPGVVALSNMPIKQQREEEGLLVTSFETSPRMSTYLLAWVIGELHKKSTTTKSGVEVSVWATPAQPAESLDFAVDIAARSIDYFDDYFGTPYPLPKSDHVALPDFSSGAMENWGLVTYREVALLADPKTASLENKQSAATVVSHELSHQWFGNLVTMKWWNDLWLNESFANMMEYLAIDAIEPTWKIWLDHATYEVVQALRRDSLEGVQAIRTDVSHPDEISALFDPSIVYAKGGRLLRMLQTYIGDEAFRAGLKNYFKTYAYSNTEANDLWQCLSEASGHDIGLLMNTWISQSGYPVVHVERNGDAIELTQEQFFIGEHQPSDKLWPIPLGAQDPAFPSLFTEKHLSVTPTPGASVILNHEGTAHFITHYSPELLAQVLEELPQLSDIDRLKLLNEYALLAQAEIISSAELITLLQHYKDEKVEAVWGVMAQVIGELKKFVELDTDAEKKLRSFVGSLSRQQYDRLGWESRNDEPEADTKLRSLILSLTLYSELPEALKTAASIYTSTPLEDLDPNLRVGIMAAAVREKTSDTVIDDLFKAYTQSNSSELREDIAAALTSTKETNEIERMLGYLQDSTIVRPQDVTRWFVSLLRNRYGRTQSWQWIRTQWEWLEKTFGGDKSYDVYPRYIATVLMTQTEYDEYKEFFTPLLPQIALKRNIEVGLVELSHRVELIDREGPQVRKALLDL